MHTHTLPRTHTHTNTCSQKEGERGEATHGILSQRFGVRTYGFTSKPVVKVLSVSSTSTKDSRQTTCGICDSFHRWGRRIESLRWEMMRPWTSALLRLKEKLKLHLGLNKRMVVFFCFFNQTRILEAAFFWICALKWSYFCDNVPGACKVKQAISCFAEWNNSKSSKSSHWLHQWWVPSWMTFMAYLNYCGCHFNRYFGSFVSNKNFSIWFIIFVLFELIFYIVIFYINL